ncbi:broad substrate specificity ATP-binding cassette transporter ABCG2 isoform X1 [Rhincodon typus]|uniref:broad substrate specificity ATP-binding cassette transporter ABCG2 isoform X1 n=1 Tax=Rhincodon typus TaxID=259920 RepID=UPI0009A34A86|nr:broad substrate specificity ATP-binding cassette transporter ABCG2 isoform X1 [Rhincodon typus]
MDDSSAIREVPMNDVSITLEQTPPEPATHLKSTGSTVSFYNIYYRVKVNSGLPCCRKINVKEILDGVNGIMGPGMNAILGPTGSGKSSLLDILAARKDPSGLKGQVLIDGAPQPPNFKCISGYVVQDDVVMGTLTVRENLQFSAALRLPKSICNAEKNNRIDQVINELGLMKVADSKVGTPFTRGVSGGERKRTNIGMELIIDPSVLFLDEPTTGLDAGTALTVLLLLQRMSRKGKTIIFSIHQPRYSIFKLFGSLTLLANGRLVYHGPSAEALDYFSGIGYTCEPFNNPADFFLDVINGDLFAVSTHKALDSYPEIVGNSSDLNKKTTIAENLASEYLKSRYYSEMMSELNKLSQGNASNSEPATRRITYTTSFLHQLKWVTKRSFKNLLRNPHASVAQVMVTLVLGLIVGAIYFGVQDDNAGIQNRAGAIFFLTTNQCFGSLSVIELFIAEKKIFMHEYISGYYRIHAYFIAKLFVDLIPMRALPAITIVTASYFLIGLKLQAGAFFIALLTLAQVSVTAASLGLAIATGQNTTAAATLMITVIFVLMILFSGLLVNLPSVVVWLNWLKYFSIPRYGVTALQVNEFVGLKFCNNSESVSIAKENNHSMNFELIICTGEEFLAKQGIEATEWALWQNHLALAGIMLICFMISFLKLRFMKKTS